MVSAIAFVGLVAAVAAQRLWELCVSGRNEAALRARGAIEHAPEQMSWMRLVHAGWLLAAPLEVWALERVATPWVAAAALALFALGQGLRYAAMRALGARWCVRVMTLPGEAPIAGGVFRWIRHPNYLGVILEIAALPLVHGAWITSITFSAVNGALLWRRIAAEEAALEAASDYRDRLGDRPRLWPRLTGG